MRARNLIKMIHRNPSYLMFILICATIAASPTQAEDIRVFKSGVRRHRVQSVTGHHAIRQSQSRLTFSGTSETRFTLHVQVGNTPGQVANSSVPVSGTNGTGTFTPTNVAVSGTATGTDSVALNETGSNAGQGTNFHTEGSGLVSTVKRISSTDYQLIDLSGIMGDGQKTGRKLHRIMGKTISHMVYFHLSYCIISSNSSSLF